jgi:hypothetical protein
MLFGNSPQDLSPLFFGRQLKQQQQPEAQKAKTKQKVFVGQDSVVVFADSWFGVRPDRIVLFHSRYPSELLRVRINKLSAMDHEAHTISAENCEVGLSF